MFRDKDYVVKDDEVLIVDEFTGRIMPGRRYSDGLHQACLLYTSWTVMEVRKNIPWIMRRAESGSQKSGRNLSRFWWQEPI